MAAPAPLAPVPHPIAIVGNSIYDQPQTLILKEKVLSLSGDSFDIKLLDGTPILRVQGQVMSLSGRKSVFDIRYGQNNHILNIVKEHFHIHTTFAIQNPQGGKILEVKSGFALIGSKATATFTSLTGEQKELKMKGNWLDSSADITDGSTGAIVARINRKFLSGRDILFGQQTYAVQVAPGVDVALVAAMCICLDEKNNEGKGGLIG